MQVSEEMLKKSSGAEEIVQGPEHKPCSFKAPVGCLTLHSLPGWELPSTAHPLIGALDLHQVQVTSELSSTAWKYLQPIPKHHSEKLREWEGTWWREGDIDGVNSVHTKPS